MQTNQIANQENTGSPFAIFQSDIEEIREAMAANVGKAGLTAGDLERIKVPAGGGTAWSVQGVDGEELVREISVIIIGWRDVRVYWRMGMEESDGNMPPDCSSLDAVTGIGKPGGDCRKCPLAQFGTDSKGEGQACKLIRELFVIRPDNVLPEIVKLPPTSGKPARQYLMRLTSKRVPCYGVITKLALEKTKNGQGIVYAKAVLTAGERLSPQQTQCARQYAMVVAPFLKATPAIAETNDQADGTDEEVV